MFINNIIYQKKQHLIETQYQYHIIKCKTTTRLGFRVHNKERRALYLVCISKFDFQILMNHLDCLDIPF